MNLGDIALDIGGWLKDKEKKLVSAFEPTTKVRVRDIARELPGAASTVLTLGLAPLVEKNVKAAFSNPSETFKKVIDASTPKVTVSPDTYFKLTGKQMPSDIVKPTVAENFNIPLTMGVTQLSGKAKPLISKAEQAFIDGQKKISGGSGFGDDFFAELESILSEKPTVAKPTKADSVRALENSIYQKVKAESTTPLEAETQSQYDQFKRLFSLPSLRSPQVKAKLLSGDLPTFQKVLSEKGIMTPEESGRLFYSQTDGENAVLEQFRELLTKENPELILGKKTAKGLNLTFKGKAFDLPDIGEPETIAGLLPSGGEQKLLGAGRLPTRKEAINIFKKTGKVVDFQTVKPSTGKPFVFGETGGNFKKIRVTGGQGVERTIPIKKPEDFVMDHLVRNPEDLKDLDGFVGVLRRGNVDAFRNFETVFGKRFNEVKALLLDPFDSAKGKYVDDWRLLADDVKKNVVDKLGIQKGSELSKLVQQYGEGKMNLSELARKTKDWRKVVEADKFFRSRYDRLVDWINESRAKIYPNNPEKLIQKRKDYYRHFQEIAEGFQGLKNLIETPSGISQSLEGISPFTQPKSKFLSLAQKREGDSSKQDAIGGYLNYIRSASFARNIDPQIARLRTFTERLRESAVEKDAPIGGFLNYLEQWTNSLSGKTEMIDRAIMERAIGRKGLAIANWFSNRFKVNAIVGNLSSALNQSLSLPLGIADSKPNNFLKGILQKNTGAQKFSSFLKERYSGDIEEQFNQNLLDQPKKLATWLFSSIEENATRAIWSGEYQRALSEGVKMGKAAVKFADDATRKVVAGRGIGEVPLLQQEKTVQILAPFQLEVMNTWLVLKRFMDEKAFGKLLTFSVSSYILAKGLKAVTGNASGFDPLGAAIEGYQDAKNQGKAVLPRILGRVGGEVLSNVPYAQNLVADFTSPQFRQEYFGRQDPTRYGAGIPVYKALTDPEKALFFFAPSWGGSQLKKSLEGLAEVDRGGVKDSKGMLKFPLEDSVSEKAKAILFGQYSGTPARIYFDSNLSPLSPQETVFLRQKTAEGADPLKLWIDIQVIKQTKRLRTKVSDINRDTSLTSKEKTEAILQATKEIQTVKNELLNYKKSL